MNAYTPARSNTLFLNSLQYTHRTSNIGSPILGDDLRSRLWVLLTCSRSTYGLSNALHIKRRWPQKYVSPQNSKTNALNLKGEGSKNEEPGVHFHAVPCSPKRYVFVPRIRNSISRSAIQLYLYLSLSLSLAESHPFFASEVTWSQLGYFLCSASPSFWRTKTCTSWTEEPLLECCPYVFMSSCSQINLPKWHVYELTRPEDPNLLPSILRVVVMCSNFSSSFVPSRDELN